MYYIAGYEFVCRQQNKQSFKMSPGSIQSNLANKNLYIQTNENQSIDSFIVGHKYKLCRILKTVLEPNKEKISYLFSDLTDPTLPDINVLMDNTFLGDEYIAQLSNTKQLLQEQRKAAVEAIEDI